LNIDWPALGVAVSSQAILILSISLGLLYAVEAARPQRQLSADAARLRHLGVNLALWFIGIFIAQFAIEPIFGLTSKLLAPDWGLASLGWPHTVTLLIGILAFDLFAYFDHRISHHFRPFWALHIVHHSDTQVDCSTAIRAHPGEAVLSVFLSFGFLALAGIPVWVYFLRAGLMAPLALFHHANIDLPSGFDRVFRLLIVSPRMHLLHHSPDERYTNSNYGHMFSVWDRLFGTYRDPDAIETIDSVSSTPHQFGLTALNAPHHQSLLGALKSPMMAFQQTRL
jgi:sterol desaturase/sphingolipid hydroxylase (fatty acid hydroxylase superfamily)